MTRAWGSARARRASSPPARRTPRAAPSGPTSTASTGRPVSMRAPSRSAAWHARRRGPHRHRRARACLLALPPPARPRMPWCRTGGGRRRQQVGMQCQRWAYNAMREGGPHLRQLAADGAHAAADHHPGPLRARQAALVRAPGTALTRCWCTLETRRICATTVTREHWLRACMRRASFPPPIACRGQITITQDRVQNPDRAPCCGTGSSGRSPACPRSRSGRTRRP